MADPVTLAMIGATAGALTDKEDPLRGAALGGLAGFTGGTALGATTAGGVAAGTTVGAGGLGGAAGTGLTASTLGGGVGAGAGLGTATGGMGLTAAASPAAMGLAAPVGTTAGGITGLSAIPTAGSLAAPIGTAAATPTMLSAGGFGAMTPMQQYAAMNVASGLLGGGEEQRTQNQQVTTQAMPRGQYQPTMTAGGLLATPDMRRRRPFAFA